MSGEKPMFAWGNPTGAAPAALKFIQRLASNIATVAAPCSHYYMWQPTCTPVCATDWSSL
jgi:hypothetical protein